MPNVDLDLISYPLRQAVMEELHRRGFMGYRPMSFDFKVEFPKPEAPKPAATPEKPTTQSIAEDIRRLAQSNLKADLSALPGVIETEEAKRKDRILSDLRSVANLAKLKDVKAKRFVLTCWEHNEATSYEGIDYAHGQYIAEEDNTDEYRVFVAGDTSDTPTGKYCTLASLKDMLDGAKIPHVISYRD